MNRFSMRAVAPAFLIAMWFTFAGSGPAQAQDTAAPQAVTPEFYASDSAWLCRPGRQDLCAGNQDTTVVGGESDRQVRAVRPDPNAPIDCFYVYPTVSDEPGANSGWTPGAGEKRAVEQQFARFASVCKPYAPMYRQVTRRGLLGLLLRGRDLDGAQMAPTMALGYGDVLAAWRYYLAHDNHGRGVVLIGHSQGSMVLAQLIRREIEGQPVQARIVSALLPGFNLEVPPGADTGGSFAQMPVCRSGTQIGCVVSYASYMASAPPPQRAVFGRARTPGMEVACTDPVALSGVPTLAMLPSHLETPSRKPNVAWSELVGTLATPFVSLPGLVEAQCVRQDGAVYLAVTLRGLSGQPVAELLDATGASGRLGAAWGLHVMDVNLVAGNLLELVRRQGAAYLAAGK